jgi:hypothetical protein
MMIYFGIDLIIVKLGFGWILILGVLYCWPIECIFFGYYAIRSVHNVDDLRNYCSWLGVLDS